MKFSYTWLKEYVRISQSPKELAELLTLRAFEVESAERSGDDTMFTIALPPNRVPDAAGHIGMAREIGALLNAKCRMPNAKLKESKNQKTKDAISVSIEDAEGCRRYCSRVMRNIMIKDSPRWLQERLTVCGLRPVNNVVDATNYVMLETGQPLHVFDYDKLDGSTIIIRRAEQGEIITTLDGRNIALCEDDCVIADAKKPIALAGIKGGDKAEVDLKTVNIALEAATFHGPRIRATSRRVNLRTDSSYRFEHNLHPDLAFFAMERLAALIQELAGGEVLKGVIDIYPRKEKPYRVFVDPSHASALAGIPISATVVEGMLKRIGASYRKKKQGFLVLPPPFRRDLNGEEDYSEEILRIHGYERIPEVFPAAFIPAEKDDEREWMRFIRQTLRGNGFSEVYRYAFIGARELKLLGRHPEEYVELENPVSPDLAYLVREPYETMLAFVGRESERTARVQIFSLEKGFFKNDETGGTGAVSFGEERYLTLVAAHLPQKGRSDQNTGFLELKGVVTDLLDSMGIDDVWFDNVPEYHSRYPKFQVFNHMHPYKRAEIKIGDEVIGVIGELHPAIVMNLKIDRRVLVCEMLLSALLRRATSEIEFRDIPKFPAIERDVAVLVPLETRIDDVQGIIENAGGALLEDTDFFDEYTGEGITEEMRSLAFRLVFRNPKRTLEEREVNESMKKIAAALQERGWEIR